MRRSRSSTSKANCELAVGESWMREETDAGTVTTTAGLCMVVNGQTSARRNAVVDASRSGAKLHRP